MKQARMIGNFVEQMVKAKAISDESLCELIGISEVQLHRFLKGQVILPFAQITKLALVLGVSVSQILNGDEDTYNRTVVHSEGSFSKNENREKILDIIDDYMDLCNALRIGE